MRTGEGPSMEMCPAEETRHLMQHLIFRVIHRDNAKSLSHFKYIGFDWNGIPAWYLWPKENPGVYAAKESWSESNGEFVRAGFTLYYYPHPEEEAFTDFSVVEQLVRVSDFFDTQGVHLFSSCCGHGHRHDHPAEKPFQDLAKEKGVPTLRLEQSVSRPLGVGTPFRTWQRRKVFRPPADGRHSVPVCISWGVSDVRGCRLDSSILRSSRSYARERLL